MPDLLMHAGTGYVLLRPLTRRENLAFLLGGAILPDLAWMVRRLLVHLSGADPVALSQWLIPWHTPWTMLLVSGAIACASARPGAAFLWTAAGAMSHLLLDAAQTRYGNGVLLLYPVVFHESSWGLFWPEDPVNRIASLLAAALLVTLIAGLFDRSPEREPAAVGGGTSRRRGVGLRASWAAVLALTLVGTTYLTRDELLRDNVFGLRFLHDPASFEGSLVALDRDRIVGEDPAVVETLNGRRFTVRGEPALKRGDVVSLVGRLEGGEIRVVRVHRHQEWIRSLSSWAGLLLVTPLLLGWRPARRPMPS